jgi:uncharacterized MnhB-related membrane protein
MILDLFYISLIVFAIIAIQATVLRNAVIYLSVFSLICSIVYLLLGAPDVAIAEATIGCTLSTILYLVALKKYRIFTVYYNFHVNDEAHFDAMQDEKEEIQTIFEHFSNAQELQLDLINTSASFTKLKQSASYDVILFHSSKGLWLHGLRNSYQYNGLLNFFEKECSRDYHAKFIHEELEWSDESPDEAEEEETNDAT